MFADFCKTNISHFMQFIHTAIRFIFLQRKRLVCEIEAEVAKSGLFAEFLPIRKFSHFTTQRFRKYEWFRGGGVVIRNEKGGKRKTSEKLF